VIWFFDRAGERLQLETRYDNATREYLLVIRHPNGRMETERFKDQDTFGARMKVMEEWLTHERWTQEGPPVLLAHGWPDVKPEF